MTVVLVGDVHTSTQDGAGLQRWIEVLEARGHTVFTLAPADTALHSDRHVAVRADTADALRALAETISAVPAPVIVVDPVKAASPLLVEEMAAQDVSRALVHSRPQTEEANGLRVESGTIIAVGSRHHQVRSPDSTFAAVLTVAARDVGDVASALRVMADVVENKEWDSPDPLALALVAIVRSGIVVEALAADVGTLPERSSESGEQHERAVRTQLAAGPPRGLSDRWIVRPTACWLSDVLWQRVDQRIGALSLSLLSAAVGVFAAVIITTQTWPGDLVAAVLLLVAAVLDRADGIVARSRRTATVLGTWVDFTAGWVRTAALLAALGWVAASTSADSEAWVMCVVALALVTAHKLVAHSAAIAHGEGTAGVPLRLPLDRDDEPEHQTSQHERRSRGSNAAGLADPIRGDGGLLMSVGIVLLSASQLVAATVIVTGVLLVVHMRVLAIRPIARAKQGLYELADPGLLTRVVHRQDPHLSAQARLAGSAAGAWLPLTTWFAEVAVLLAAWRLTASGPPGGVAVLWLVVVGFHRMEIGVRLRVLRQSPPEELSVLTWGWLGRSVLIVVLAAVGALGLGLAAAAVVLGAVVASESAFRFSAASAGNVADVVGRVAHD